MDTLKGILDALLVTDPESLSLLQWIGALTIAYLGGIFSSLTPCVYPMIPITIGVVGGMGPSHQGLFLRVTCYVLGMALVYAPLGVLAGLTGSVFGTLTNTPGWYIGVGVFFIVAALFMMDLVPLDPIEWFHSIRRRFFGSKVNGSAPTTDSKAYGAWGSFALGLSSGFIAAPCTTPVMAAILAYIAKTRSVALGFGLMMSFAVGLGSLLVVLALFAGKLGRLPKSGQWLAWIKRVSGAILLCFAVYLIWKAFESGSGGTL